MNRFTPDAYAVAHRATAFAHEMHYTIAGREHMLYAFATGLDNAVIHRAFESCGLTPDRVRDAIVVIDGPMRPATPHAVHYVHHDPTLTPAFTQGIETLIARQIFVNLTANADMVFKMAQADVGEDQWVYAEDVLRIFIREVDRSEEVDREHRVMQVVHEVAPDLTLADIKLAMVASLDVAIAEEESAHGKVIIVDKSTLTEPQQEIVRLKRARHEFANVGVLQGA